MTIQDTTPSTVEERVMANVGVIYTSRRAVCATALKSYVLVLAALALWKLVWVTRVEQNFLHMLNGGVLSAGNYVLYALVHTHPAVQLTLGIGVVAFVLLASDLYRATSPKQQYSF